MARLPLITSRREIDVRVVFGQSIFELYQQIQNLLRREAPTVSRFFAEPIVNAVRGEISWNTTAVGRVKPAADLSQDEWVQVGNRLKQNIEIIEQLVGRLEKANQSNSAGVEALRGMLVTPDLKRSLFLVGDDIVLTQWGCYQFGTDARSADLFEQIEKQSKPTPSLASPQALEPSEFSPNSSPVDIAPTQGEMSRASTPSEQGPSESVISDGAPAASSERRSILWRWLLLLILLLLLLLGILWKYWQIHNLDYEENLRVEVSDLLQKLGNKANECGLLPSSTGGGAITPQAPVSDADFKDRQTEKSIKSDSMVNISLAWNDIADLDLSVTQPDGHKVYFKPCFSPTCGILDVDANYCDPQFPCVNLQERPLENISWRVQMPKGRYDVYVQLYSTNRTATESRAIPFTVQVTKNGKPTTYPGVIRRENIICNARCSSRPILITQFTIE